MRNKRRHDLASESRIKFEAAENIESKIHHLSPFSGIKSRKANSNLHNSMLRESRSPTNTTFRIFEPNFDHEMKSSNPISAKCRSSVLFKLNSKLHEFDSPKSSRRSPRSDSNDDEHTL